jgi:hypothetical protein
MNARRGQMIPLILTHGRRPCRRPAETADKVNPEDFDIVAVSTVDLARQMGA